MEDVRQLVQEEGREARNLVAFHVAVDTPGSAAASRISRKPPRSLAPPVRRAPPRSVARRSASAGRDKRSELRARYWALLFGDLQRAIGEIYNTVEAHENLNECQEVILVLENYTRDFKALGEWFRLKWEYDNTPPPQRPQSLAWEIRKTDFVRPESRRTHSVKSSPSVSGKNSPCLSGHNTPSGKNSPVTGKSSPGSGKISPRISGHATSPKANLEFFGSKVMSKIATKPEVKTVKEGRLSDIKEKDVKDSPEEEKVVLVSDDATADSKQPDQKPIVELGKAKECSNISPKQVVIKSPRHVKTETKPAEELSSQGKATTAKLDAMENEFLAKNLVENSAKNDNLLNQDVETEKPSETVQNDQDKHSGGNASDLAKDSHSESPTKSEDNFADVSNESSPIADENQPDKNKERNAELPENKREMNSEEPSKQSIEVKTVSSQSDAKDEKTSEPLKEQEKETDKIKEGAEKDDAKKEQDTKKAEIKTEQKPCSRPAYSQAAAKPKPVTTKPELKPPVRATTPILRSKTIVEIGPNTVSKTRQFPKRNQTSKCSYPFNLTTGRTSLFDSAPSTKVVKKPLNRNVPMASGDTKPGQNKIEPPKKRPPRPTSLKLNEKGDKKETANPSLEKIKDCDEYSSTDTIVTQIDMSRIESSESLKTLVPEDQIRDVANSVEVLNVDNNKSDNDGWLTVKSRRLSRESKKQSKSHWSNRFHQPSATTSLPTLNMIESPKQEVNPIVHAHKAKLDRAKSEQPETVKTPRKAEKVKVTVKPKAVSKMKDPAMIRQKSDVTGLKTHSARNKAAKREKIKDLNKTEGELTINRLHSSLESLTGLARSQESTEDAFDFDKWKAEFKSTYFKYLDEDDHMTNHNEILKTADPSEMSEIAEMTSQIEENEKKLSWALDFQTDVDQRKLCEEEDLLNRQILELQEVSDIDMDTETDDTETDAEILIEEPHLTTSQETLGALATSLEHQYETALAGMSWAERVDTLVVLEALVARDPGRAQQLHAKLSQGIKRRGSLQDALRRLQAKQARAERQRLEYQTERAKKIHQLLARVEEVKVAKNQLIEEKRMRMERRLQKAAENRDQHLKDIVRKAHDEEEKLREIAFIKQLEAENRRHEFLDQCRSHTTRLRQMRRDRLSKLEQKAAREAAVGARRAALEAARRRHVAGLLQRRRERDARVDQLKELKKQERGDAAREKAEGVKSRLSALAAAAELEADALRSRIRDKQDASQQRLESHLQAIREKATRQAASESQDLISKEERELQEEAERLEQERREREKQKAVKKRARKVKQKLLATANETLLLDENTTIEPNNPSTNKLYKVVHQLSNILTPLLDTDNNDNGKQNNDTVKQNGNTGKANHDAGKMNDKVDDIIVINDEVEKNNKKNKSKNNNNKITNGIDGNESAETKKSKKKKNTDEKLAENVKNAGNNKEKDVTPVKEIIIAENTASDSVSSINVSKKKNKKNKNSNTDKNEITNMKEPPKLVKTGSICSSLSDTSKASYRSDKRTKVNIDSTLLERHLNELHRMMDKDKTSNDKAIPQKLHGLKTLGHLMAVAAEREDLASQFTTKCLTTAVTIISRVISTCKTSAAYFITTNMCVHIVKLLSTQLEKDLHSDQKETELAKQLSDCLAVALDSVLYATRTHEKNRGDEKESGDELLTALRSRAHTLISYLCLCGCVTKAEAAGEVTGNVQTLVTVCVDLCQPCDVDAGTERTSAVQSLRIALGTSICLSRAELCTIFNDEQSLGEAARSVSLLRSTAELDYRIVQEAFGEGGWPLEFRAAVARLLSQYAPNDKDAPKSNSRLNERLEQSVAESMVLDLIVLVGFVVVNNPQMQETICDGWSVIKTLCTLPANWLVSRSHSPALLPTLAALAEWPSAHAAIAAELSLEMIEEFLESAEAQKVKLVQVMKQGRAKKATVKNKKQ